MATCASGGQAVGTAAALGVRSEVVPRDMAAQALFVRELQQTLVRDDCFIPGVKAEDDLDGARSAQVTASSYVEGGRPGSILSGETRAVPFSSEKRMAAWPMGAARTSSTWR